jgi:hypothetical protein
MEPSPLDPSQLPARLHAELTLARYLGQGFRGDDLRAAALGLPLVLDFIALHHVDETEFAWDRFDPRAYVAVIRDIEDDEAAFLKALLRESRLFFAYLAEQGELSPPHGARVRREIDRALRELRD